jgi:hypothetical protein
MFTRARLLIPVSCSIAWASGLSAYSQEIDFDQLMKSGVAGPIAAADSGKAPAEVLSPAEWRRVDQSVNSGLSWLAANQQPDGSFPSIDLGQPGVTGLCVLAFMSHGHIPGEGPYGAGLSRAIDYIAASQKPSGLITVYGPDGTQISRNVGHDIGVAAAYNHAISSLVLSESYGMSDAARTEKTRRAIDQALAATLAMQHWPKDRAIDRGGWRYIHDFDDRDSDLSLTGWSLMFLRSARNAGFEVPKEPIDEAVAYIRRCFSPEYATFEYLPGDRDGSDRRSRAMAGAGVLALAHAGFHHSLEAQRAGEFILQHNVVNYNENVPAWDHDRYHYSLFNCCQGMYQLGGRYWSEFFPPVVQSLLENQQPDGSWPAESSYQDGKFGNAYTTALVLMSLGAPNQLLPVFQR